MEIIHQLFYANLDVVFFVYGLAFVTMGVTVLVQPKKGSEFEIAHIFWLLAAFGITHGINELLDMWAIIKGRFPLLDLARWCILVISYLFLFEFGRRLFCLHSPKSPLWQRRISKILVWWLLPLTVIIILTFGITASDPWRTGSIWTRYMFGLPGGLLIGLGFRQYFYHEENILKPLRVKKYFLCGGVTFFVYGFLGGIVVPKGNFFPANWLNNESFLLSIKIPVQVFRMICAIIATWAISGMLTIFNWEIRRKLEDTKLILKQQLKTSETRYMEVVESSSDIIYSIDTDGYIISSNKRGYELLGYLQSDIVGRLFKDICTPETWTSLNKGFNKIKLEGSVFLGEGKIIKINGEKLDVTLHSFAMYDSNKNFLGVRLIMRDITEHKQMEAEFQKIEKLESIGLMAGGIAHDFNNILTTVAGNISLARNTAKNHDNLTEILSDAQAACHHAKYLTNQLLTFSRGGSPIKKITDIKDLLKVSAKFAIRGSSVNCKFSIADDLRPVEIDEGQIIQVIHNLVLNAQQAMPKAGTIEIKAENIVNEKNNIPHLPGGRLIKITVKDQGSGIPEEIINKIFDPFYTTKKDGSGLGLACTYSIIKNHGGHIEVSSEVGVGTTFYVYLQASAEPAQAVIKTPDKAITGSGYILLMDDEKNVRKSVTKILKYLGYDVETVKNGEEAIELYKTALTSPRPFDAVIIDLTIRGGMGGKEAMEHLLEIDPEIKAIVSSGYFDDPVMANYKQHGFCGVIPKPYDIEDFSVLLNKVLTKSN